MIFFAYATNAAYGTCDCNYNDNGRAMIYEPTANKCHFVFTRVSILSLTAIITIITSTEP